MATRTQQANIYEQGLDRNSANFQPLTPLTFLEWSATVYPDQTAVVHGEARKLAGLVTQSINSNR